MNREIPIRDFDEGPAHAVELEPGQASVHDIGAIHGAAANASGRRRAGVAMRCMPATSCVQRRIENAAADWGDLPVEPVRGRNRHPGADVSLDDSGEPRPAG